jgi:hypothetical protein
MSMLGSSGLTMVRQLISGLSERIRKIQELQATLTEQQQTLLTQQQLLDAQTKLRQPSVGAPVTVGALSLGQTASVVIPFAPALPDTNYVAIPVLYGTTSLLGNLSLGGITARTTSSVTVSVKAPVLAVAAGATVGVAVFRIA